MAPTILLKPPERLNLLGGFLFVNSVGIQFCTGMKGTEDILCKLKGSSLCISSLTVWDFVVMETSEANKAC
jgi:hypothetical protein